MGFSFVDAFDFYKFHKIFCPSNSMFLIDMKKDMQLSREESAVTTGEWRQWKKVGTTCSLQRFATYHLHVEDAPG